LRLPVGLYLDLAVGVRPDGFDAWNEQAAITRALSVGAPPDLLNTAGQNWRLAGFNAAVLARQDYAAFRAMLRAAMRYGGAVRLDHAMGLKRLYLIPHGFAADDGVYVRMPFEALLAVLAEESLRYSSIVIGEDLGTVPEGLREQLAAWGLWRMRVMMFERARGGAFYGAETYPPDTLATFGTHDLATFAGWVRGHDLVLKRSLGLDPGESIEARRAGVTHLKNALGGRDDVFAAIEFLARAPSRIVAVMVEDLLGLLDQPNIPGTTDAHPNWRRRLPVAIEDFSRSIDVARLREALADRNLQVD
jgi:4-alpha-glucanotransferase